MNLTKQERKVFDYILAHPGCTTRDIQRDTWITCPSGRITEMRKKSIAIISVGKKHYDGAHPFEMYAIQNDEFELRARQNNIMKQIAPQLDEAARQLRLEIAG
jgi:hypothetical protein